MIKQIITFSAIVFLSAAAVADVTIEQIAPKNSFAVVGITNVDRSIKRARTTGFYDLWQDEQIQELFAETREKMVENLNEMYRELEVEEGSLVAPTGAVGMAMFTRNNAETELPELGMIAFADYGENAENMASLIQAMLDKGVEENDLEYEATKVNGREVLIFDLPDPPENDQRNGQAGGPPVAQLGPDPSKMLEGFDKLFYTRDASRFLLSSNVETLSEALLAIDGDGRAGVGQEESFLRIRDQVGSGELYAVVRFDQMSDMSQMLGMGMFDIKPYIKLLFGDIEGIGYSAKLNSNTAMMESTMGLRIAGEKTGLPALLDVQSPTSAPPAFIGPDAMSYWRMNFRFDGVMELVRKIVRNLPENQQQMFKPTLEQIGPMLEQTFGAMGPGIHGASSLNRPVDIESSSGLTAIESSNPEAVRPVIGMFAPQAGMAERDFLGHSIWSSNNEFMPTAIGLGGGFMFIGPPEQVEQALRSIGEQDQPQLAADSSLQRSLDSLGQDGAIGWGYADTASSFEYQRAVMMEFSKMANQNALPNDQADQMMSEFEKTTTEMMQEITPELIGKYIGPQSWQLLSTDEGFLFKSYVLAPVEEDS